MEDNGRELEPDPVDTSPDKDGYPNSKELTIMLIGSVGKMRSFKISRKLILYTLIFFIIYIIISLFIFYLYLDLYTSHKAQSDKLHIFETELRDKTKALEQNKLYIKVLEDHRKGLDVKAGTDINQKKSPEQGSPKVDVPKMSKVAAQKRVEEKAADTDTAKRKAPESSGPEVSAQGETKSPAAVPEEVIKDPMELRDIDFKRADSELTLNFVLANKLAEKKTAEGYIHIIVMNKDKECPTDWNNSYNKLTNGFPINFNRGQQFLIQRFRPYQRKYKANPDSELPSFIRILVYDRSGQKILGKEFPVTDESANDPS